MPALAPVDSSELDIAGVLPWEVDVDGGVGSTVVGVTELDDEAATVDEKDSVTEVVIETVKLVGVALPSVCVVMVEISVVVMTTEVRVADEMMTVVGGWTETTVVVIEDGGSVDFEESVCFLLPPLPPSPLSSSEHVRISDSRTSASQTLVKRTVLVVIAISVVSIAFVTTLLLSPVVTSSSTVAPIPIIVVAPCIAPIVSRPKCK